MFRFNNISSFNQLIFLLIITLASWLLISITALYLGTLIWHIDFEKASGLIYSTPGFARYIQITQSIALFILPPAIFVMITQNDPIKWLKLERPTILNLGLTILIVIIVQPLISYLGYVNSNIHFPDYLSNVENWIRLREEEAMKLTEIFLNTSNWFLIVLNIIIIAIIPAIGEELLFRGSLQKLITAISKNHHLSIFITAFVFSAMHMQFFGFFPRFVLGVIFGYLVVYGRNLWLPITAHFINNFSAFLIYNIAAYKNEISSNNPLNASENQPNLFYVVLSTIGAITIIVLLKRKNQH